MPLPSLPEPLDARPGQRANARGPLTTELRSGYDGADGRGISAAAGVRAAACDACSDGADRAGVRAARTGVDEQAAMDDAVEAALEAAAAGAGMAAFAGVPTAGNAGGSWVHAALASPSDLSDISPAPLSGRSRAQQEAAARRVATRASSCAARPKASSSRRHKSPHAPAEPYLIDLPEGASPRELARLHGAARTMERLKHDLSMTRQMIQNGTHSARSKRAHTSELHALQDQLSSVRRIFERQVHTHHVSTTLLHVYIRTAVYILL